MSKRQAVPPRLTQTWPSCPPLSHRSPLTTLALHHRTQASSFPPRCGLRLPLVSEQGHPGHDTPGAAIARSRSQWRGPGTSSPGRVTHCVAGATTRRTPYSSKLDLEQGTRHLAINYPPMGHRTPLFLFPDWAAGCGLFTYTDQPTGRPSRVAHPVFTPSCCSWEPCSASPVGRLVTMSFRAKKAGGSPLVNSYCRGASMAHTDTNPCCMPVVLLGCALLRR